MNRFRITLTDEQGVVLDTWTVGDDVENDNFSIDEGAARYMGEDIWGAVKKNLDRA